VTDCNELFIDFPGFGSRKIQADFGGGDVSSDGGVLLVRQVDRRLGLTQRLSELLPDRRDPDRITHSHRNVAPAAHLRLGFGLRRPRMTTTPCARTRCGKRQPSATKPWAAARPYAGGKTGPGVRKPG
jgi:hypothetical protein